jgi:hypothetical protein
MTDGNRGKSNQRLRIKMDEIIGQVPVGETIETRRVVPILQGMHKNIMMNNRRASHLLKERDDVRWKGDGLWEKVPV